MVPIFRTPGETIVIPALSVVVKFLGFSSQKGAEIGVAAPRQHLIQRGEKCDLPEFVPYLPAYHTDPRAIEARKVLAQVASEHYNARKSLS